MENKIRKAIREQIKKLHEGLGTSALQVTMENGVVAIIEDPKDIEAYDRGLTVWGTDADGKEHELNIDWSLDSHMTANEGMSPEEWVDAKEAERLAKHPEREKIMKIKQMMDKEKGITEMEDSEDDKENESLNEDLESLMAQGEKMQAFVDKQGKKAGYEGGVHSPVGGVLTALKVEGGPGFDGDDEMRGYYTRKLAKAIETQKGRKYMGGLKEAAIQLGYLKEDDMLKKIEDGINALTGGGSHHASVSDRGDKIRVKFSYAREEFDPEEWGKIINYLEGMGFFILEESNSYEANYDREEPPEAVPTIFMKQVDTSTAGLEPADDIDPLASDDRDNFPNPEDLK